MKKYGKYEKRPEGVPEKQPKVKSALLQTYFTSLLCMVLCVTMFFGTSYAWFTSEVNNTDNEIYIGTLDVGLFKENGTDFPDNLADSDKTLFDSNIRWEPGYTALETIKVVNEGDLAFKYVLNFTDGQAKNADNTDAVLADVAKFFDVWVYDHRANEGKASVAADPDSYAALTAANSGWIPAGSLDELLAGKAVLDGVMVTVRQDDKADDPTTPNETDDGVATEDTYTIALHMKEDTDSAVMGQRISLNVKLVAYQMASESEKDGFGNQNYDSNVTAVSDAKSLQSALSSGGNTQLITSLEIKDAADRVTMNGGVLYGNGKTITFSGKRPGEYSVGVLTTTGGTIKNLKVISNGDGRALYITNLTSDLFVSDCTFSGAYAFNLTSTTPTDYSINFTNTTFKSWTSYDNVISCANFTGCTFEDVLKPYGQTVLTDCVFAAEKLDVSRLQAGETITLTNCTYNGVTIASATITAAAAADGTVTVTCDSNLLEISGDFVVLKE